ncbi:MAG: N-acetylmuramoyl-L-alanine amidase [Chlorobi bacterium]|nr:N-acetylmuramoyl-L-alanine amidase [Chlorobiota bacterium]
MIFFSSGVNGQRGSKITTVVIDAGHGGKDPGALGKHSREKEITLAVALKTGHYIEKYLPDVKVIYTRKDDRFVGLYKRAEIANKNKADFFISIHCNSNKSPTPYGAETYVMGLHKSKANLDVAMMENAAIMFEADAGKTYDGFDATSAESYIQFSLFQSEYLDQSLQLAYDIQRQFHDRVGRRDRGVHQAGFLVLWKTAMPGVLVELGYLSNPTEEKFLMSEKGQIYLASAIYRAFKEYKLEYEKQNEIVKKPEKKVPVKSNLNYRVQFFTNKKKIPLTNRRFKKTDDVQVYHQNGLYKYTSGEFSTLDSANRHLKKIKKAGFKDAFVVVFNGQERISFEEAKKLK